MNLIIIVGKLQNIDRQVCTRKSQKAVNIKSANLVYGLMILSVLYTFSMYMYIP